METEEINAEMKKESGSNNKDVKFSQPLSNSQIFQHMVFKVVSAFKNYIQHFQSINQHLKAASIKIYVTFPPMFPCASVTH